ncbi:hypothetical protein GCM10008957_46720 [Deinococcus ruber]|uniref:Uncharacterized protein n=1 Tax=Deinococcus ruber TaxID=1848197 RepID=A0A918CNP0_9DEIO|nr:hypothetical protein GCM10008957_46720 [Deinococcus ruber]
MLEGKDAITEKVQPLGEEVAEQEEGGDLEAALWQGDVREPVQQQEEGCEPAGEVEETNCWTDQKGMTHATVFREGCVGFPDGFEFPPASPSIVELKIEVWGDEQGAEEQAHPEADGGEGMIEDQETATDKRRAGEVDSGVLVAVHAGSVACLEVAWFSLLGCDQGY